MKRILHRVFWWISFSALIGGAIISTGRTADEYATYIGSNRAALLNTLMGLLAFYTVWMFFRSLLDMVRERRHLWWLWILLQLLFPIVGTYIYAEFFLFGRRSSSSPHSTNELENWSTTCSPVEIKQLLRKRGIAALIDHGLFWALFVIAILLFGEFTLYESRIEGAAATWLVFFWVLYFPVCEATLGFTLGKRLTGIRVMRKDGDRPKSWQTFARHLMDPVDALVLGLSMLPSSRSGKIPRRLGDFVGQTWVTLVRRNDPGCNKKTSEFNS